ncbi:methyl-accepting chemotaxis protein [Vibrio sp. IRLE0018]|uniref:methyl-accepting chemotaxis protein n=1 Tax=Vibrio TaxID=662 RepID=UPI001592DE45|nr:MULTISPECIES: methyl-accepting chemotaxis protein [Vibrio]MCF8777840.1 methyl-accepting chemotaxis protein [Vibrio floridensis]NVC64289.1 methyl-accepting chemotaxis protein [Vibrio sp. 05-20-BW147]
MKLSDLSVKYKLLSLVMVAVFLIAITCLYNLNEQRKSSLAERESKLSAQVETAVNLINYYRSQSTQLGQSEAQSRAINAINQLRYDGDNYFWITNPQVVVITHPLKPELNGKSAKDFKDGSGKFHWREMADVTAKSGQGFLDYRWKSPQGELKDKISYVASVPEWNWIVGSGILVADIQEAFYAQMLKETMIALVMAALLLAMGYVISSNIVLPLNRLIENTNQIADGDLRVRLNFNRKDELGVMSREIDRMLEKLQLTLLTAHDASEQAALMAQNIAQASEEAATSVGSQHSQLEQLSTAMTEMSTTIADVANNAENTAHTTGLVTAHAEQSGQSMSKTSETISKVSHEISSADQLVTELKLGVQEISAVVSVIREVSEQTNLLALNAAIEAARAGEQGRGFAVVADEVRNLASRTQQSTTEVQQTIDRLTERTERTVKAMERSNSQVEQSVAITLETQKQLSLMVTELVKSNDMVAQIAAASEQQGLVANEMTENVTAIHLAANEVMQSSLSLAQDSQSMAATAEILNDQLRYFKV